MQKVCRVQSYRGDIYLPLFNLSIVTLQIFLMFMMSFLFAGRHELSIIMAWPMVKVIKPNNKLSKKSHLGFHLQIYSSFSVGRQDVLVCIPCGYRTFLVSINCLGNSLTSNKWTCPLIPIKPKHSQSNGEMKKLSKFKFKSFLTKN